MPSRKAGSRHSSFVTSYFLWLLGAFTVMTAWALVAWQGEEGSPPEKPLERRSPERIRETGTRAVQEATTLLSPPAPASSALVSAGPNSPAASPVPTDPFTAFLEAAKTDPGLLTRPVSVPDGEQMAPEAFKQALEAAKPPEPLPTDSPFGSPR